MNKLELQGKEKNMHREGLDLQFKYFAITIKVKSKNSLSFKIVK